VGNRPSVPEIITVNSEELQTLIRDLLPSQNGFGSELQASNVITPVIDLTPTAEGSTLRSDLQRALAFGSQTAFSENNSSSTIANSPGFYRVFGIVIAQNITTGAASSAFFTLTDGASSKTIYDLTCDSSQTTNSAVALSETYDFTVWLAAGESLTAESSSTLAFNKGSIRQIADSEGKFVNPSGFPL